MKRVSCVSLPMFPLQIVLRDRSHWHGAPIAIVDDVMTTGGTVEELSVLLKLNGVDYVEVWCIARARGASA